MHLFHDISKILYFSEAHSCGTSISLHYYRQLNWNQAQCQILLLVSEKWLLFLICLTPDTCSLRVKG